MSSLSNLIKVIAYSLGAGFGVYYAIAGENDIAQILGLALCVYCVTVDK